MPRRHPHPQDEQPGDLRTRVLELLRSRPGEAVSLRDLRDALHVPADDRRDLRHVLAELVEEGALSQSAGRRYAAVAEAPTVEGVVVCHPRGFGFLTQVRGAGLEEDPLIPPPFMVGLLPGDRVRARLERGRGGRVRAMPVSVVEAHPVVVGTLRGHGKRLWLEVEGVETGLRVDGADAGAAPVAGMVARARVERRPDGGGPGSVHVLEVMGEAGALAAEVERLVVMARVPRTFQRAALAVAERAGDDIVAEAAADKRRRDIRSLALVTIDGEDARDFDDAVHVEAHGRDFVLTVAIADVAHYVTEGSALDLEAAERGTSVYLPGRVIPMLPERLSNHLCSLRPDEPRLCVCARLSYRHGTAMPHHAEFFTGLMQSRARLTYNRVHEFAEQGAVEIPGAPGWDLRAALALYRQLRDGRLERGALDLDLPEVRARLDARGEPVDLSPSPRFESHRLIEEFMIAANEAVARHMDGLHVPTVFRIHEPPDEEKLARFRLLARAFAHDVPLKDSPRPHELARFLETLRARPGSQVLQPLLLRAMMQARYDTVNRGHYGLASTAYLHFTSPIRRYPDLLVHRALKRVLAGEKADESLVARRARELQANAEQSSNAERRSTDLERKTDSLYAARFMQQHVDKVLDGVITGCVEHGLYVRLIPYGAEGLVPVESLGGDSWELDPSGGWLSARRSGRRLALGMAVQVRVMVADLQRRQVLLQLEGEHAVKGGGPHARGIDRSALARSGRHAPRHGGGPRHGGPERPERGGRRGGSGGKGKGHGGPPRGRKGRR